MSSGFHLLSHFLRLMVLLMVGVEIGNKMNDLNGDNIWEYTISLNSGVYQYKYSTDNWLNSEDLTNVGSCVYPHGGTPMNS